MVISFKLFVTAVFTALIIASGINAQLVSAPPADDTFAASVEWTQYKIPTQNLSVAMPKMPVVLPVSDLCAQTEGARYIAYAAGSVYEFVWHAKSSQPYPKYCEKTESFSKKQYQDKLVEVRNAVGVVESEMKIMGNMAKVFRNELETLEKTQVIVWDIDRWLQLTISRRKGEQPADEKFVSSVSVPNENVVEIGSGSLAMLGDKPFVATKVAEDNFASKTDGIIIVAKPRPGYTEQARKTNTQGTVVLRVTFLRNGGIGAVTVSKQLEYGLTEKAIAAARKISFLPMRMAGVPQTVVKQVEYSFSIY